ncbi:MAG: cytochrome c [Azospirillaceae bacterium]|nr:cytochrome c [Azospirillaceae bacterium]
MTMKKIILSVAALAVVAGAAAVTYAYLPTTTRAITLAPALDDAQAVERGRYIATASDCAACHTAPGGKPFAGGLPFATPIGTIRSTNITPDADTGLGHYTLADFDRALRHGIAKNGDTLYPAMPYPSYAHLTDQDVTDLYAYMMKGVEPVKQANQAGDIPFPLSMRWPLAIWRKTFAPNADQPLFDAARYTDPEVARGAYLVQGPGHCGACHTPRSPTLNEKGLDDRSPDYLAGGQVIDGWYAVNLRSNKAEGLGNWSRDDIVATLTTGRNPHHAVTGAPMADVVRLSMQKLNDADVQAIAAYLKTLAPAAHEDARFTGNDATTPALLAGQDLGRGEEIYVDSCSACHKSNGQGNPNAFPALANNPSVLSPEPVTVIRAVLFGTAMPATEKRPSNLGMPGFALRYSDDEVAALVTFLRKSWGNEAAPVTAAQVRDVRAHPPEAH